jgi:hypothetical protein
MMGEFVLRTCVMGGAPLALALVQRAAEWSRDAALAAATALRPAAEERGGRGGPLPWGHA